MEKDAIISKCGNYRYSLSRIWDKDKPLVMFLMFNPSTADTDRDDPTIRKCIGYAKNWGYGGILVGNLFAFRSSDPLDLLYSDNPIGKHNGEYLEKMFDKSSIIIFAWGNQKILDKIYDGPFKDFSKNKNREKYYYLELSKRGTPKHPLYLKKELKPIKYYL